jgi:hypothetical protein
LEEQRVEPLPYAIGSAGPEGVELLG